VIKLSLSLGLLGLVLYFVDFQVLVDIVVNLNPWYLVALFALIYVDRALMAYKWNPLLQAANVRLPFSLLFRTYLIAPMTGMLLPSAIGGDIFRVYSLSRHKVDTRAVLASIVAERVIGFVAMLTLVAVSLGLAFYLLRDSWVHFKQVGLVLLLGALVAVGLLGAALGPFQRAMNTLASRFAKYPFVSKLHQLYILYSEYQNHGRTLAVVFAWTFVEQLAPVSGIFLSARAFHINVSLVELIVIVPIITLIARLPISLEGLGVTEGLFVVMFGLVGVSATEALVIATFSRALAYLPGLPWAIHYIAKGGDTALPEHPINAVKPTGAHE
jgi:hypothetical protein